MMSLVKSRRRRLKHPRHRQRQQLLQARPRKQPLMRDEIVGRPDCGRLGHAKSDAYTEPFLVEALWRREVAEEHTDRTKALG